MQINFTCVRWQNFLSTGNQWTEVRLNKSKSTLIVGKNGSGKSTFLDALMFGLYGKAYRNINKPMLINSITKKNTLVEVEFSIGKKNYLVRRGINPDIFEIHCNGKLVNQEAKNRDYQKTFVKNTLRLSDKSFKQIVVLGSANYVPFMQLEAWKRREIIEDLLDIQVFTTMNILLKNKKDANLDRITETNTRIKILESKVELSKKHIQSLKVNNDELIALKEAKVKKFEEEIQVASDNIAMFTENLAYYQNQLPDYDKAAARLEKLRELEKTLATRAKKLEKDINFFHDNDDCPTCKQGIQHDFKKETIDVRSKKLTEVSEAIGTINDELQQINAKLEDLNTLNQSITFLNSSISDNNNIITFNNKNINEISKEIEELRSKSSDHDNETELREFIADLKDLNKEKEKLVKHQNIIEISGALLKDTGIKTRVIKQYVPVMNKLINKYLQQMEFFVDFTIDENFNEVIKSRHRDEFRYESFSEGEKARIDLAILFAWRAIAKIRNSAGANILIMDEIFDGSLDSTGSDELLRILESVTGDTNVFIISHKDTLYDKFHSIVTFEKINNFSQIKRN